MALSISSPVYELVLNTSLDKMNSRIDPRDHWRDPTVRPTSRSQYNAWAWRHRWRRNSRWPSVRFDVGGVDTPDAFDLPQEGAFFMLRDQYDHRIAIPHAFSS